ncbi:MULTISPECIES: sulfite exporter TauE/SafE family protein [unclassified Pseudoalteromonas]|uniref:sulfite exporter TauE/SafE family protein n=1 Tax=unclassified Pseudoalteromonas TaxID=194690 RepID=UPI000CF742DB|nr:MULTISPECIES: sulfite exporter TauE/SafE family protein [unclassified Pseudoalteromonas]
MADLIWLFILCMALGSVVGFLAGLLGIGGGLLIVPALSALLVHFNVTDVEHVLVIAIATSLASILFTSTSSALAHHRNQNVPWEVAPAVLFGVSTGALISGFMASYIPQQGLKAIFAVAVIFIAMRMIYSSHRATSTRPMPSDVVILGSTSVLGALSGLIGIGGGALLVPLLNYFSVDMKKAIGCAAVSGIAIALFGCLGYIASGWQVQDIGDGFVGFVYVPALAGIVATSWFTAPFGARATHYLPVSHIKKIFALLLVIIALRMVFS